MIKVCFLLVGKYLLYHDHQPVECRYTFCDDTCSEALCIKLWLSQSPEAIDQVVNISGRNLCE